MESQDTVEVRIEFSDEMTKFMIHIRIRLYFNITVNQYFAQDVLKLTHRLYWLKTLFP